MELFDIKYISKTIISEKTNRYRASVTCIEKRISFKKGIVLNCFYIMETNLASKLQQQIKNISRKTKTNYGDRRLSRNEILLTFSQNVRRYFTEPFEVKYQKHINN